VSFQEVVHSKRIEETGVTTRPVRRIAPNEHP
jgi:putative transposase